LRTLHPRRSHVFCAPLAEILATQDRKAVAAGYCRTIIARLPEFEQFRKDLAFQAIVAAPLRAAGI
jgi:hypothetical protein